MDITEDAVHAKDRKAFQSLQMKLQKIENLHTENERITAKESTQGGLTPGNTYSYTFFRGTSQNFMH